MKKVLFFIVLFIYSLTLFGCKPASSLPYPTPKPPYHICSIDLTSLDGEEKIDIYSARVYEKVPILELGKDYYLLFTTGPGPIRITYMGIQIDFEEEFLTIQEVPEIASGQKYLLRGIQEGNNISVKIKIKSEEDDNLYDDEVEFFVNIAQLNHN